MNRRRFLKWFGIGATAPAIPAIAFPSGLLTDRLSTRDTTRSELLFADFKAQTRLLLINKVRRISWGVDLDGADVPIESCWLYVIHPDDEWDVRLFLQFLPSHAYAGRSRFHHNEIGALMGYGARVIVDPSHVGTPKVFGAGQRIAVVA